MPTVASSGLQGYNADSVTTTPAFAVTAGQKVLVFATWQTDSTPPTVSGSPTLLQTGQSGTIVSSGNWYGAWVIDIGADNPSYVITASKSFGFTSVFWVVVDGPFSATDSVELALDTSPFSIDITTTAGALLVGYFTPEGQSDLTSIDGTPTGFTELQEILSFSFWQGATAQRPVASAGTYTWAPTVSGGSVVTAGLVLVALYGPALSWQPGTTKRRAAGVWAGSLIRKWVSGAWVTGLIKGYK